MPFGLFVTPATELFPGAGLGLLLHPAQYKIKNFTGLFRGRVWPQQPFRVVFFHFNERLDLASIFFYDLEIAEVGCFLTQKFRIAF